MEYVQVGLETWFQSKNLLQCWILSKRNHLRVPECILFSTEIDLSKNFLNDKKLFISNLPQWDQY